MCGGAAGCGRTRKDAAGHVDQWPSGIGHWHVCQPGNILAIIFAFEPHYNGNYTQEAATTWAAARAPLVPQLPPLQLQAAWYPWHPQHPRQCHVKRQRAQPNVGLADGQTDAYNSDGRQSTLTLTLPLTLTLTSALSLTGVTRPPPTVWDACHGLSAVAKYANCAYLAQTS